MKLGVFAVLFQDKSFEEALDYVAELGIEAVELGTGNYPGNQFADPDTLLGNKEAQQKLKKAIADRGLVISALSQHGEPLHPDPEIAKKSHETWRKTLELAEELEVPIVNGFSGCPGGGPDDRTPNWITVAWPPHFVESLEWQWNEVAIPYWQREHEEAVKRGVKIAFEAHPGMLVYNPATLLRLREACGPNIGCNFDPSHFVWQGIEPIEAIRELGKAGAIFHAHAKDIWLDKPNIAVNGVLDTKSYTEIPDRSWTFRTCGYGHGEHYWREIVSALRLYGYDHVLSIEHEDGLMSPGEGLSKAVKVLNPILINEPAGEMYWA